MMESNSIINPVWRLKYESVEYNCTNDNLLIDAQGKNKCKLWNQKHKMWGENTKVLLNMC